MCSPSAPSQPTSTTQTTIPEYARPTAERLVGRAEALSEKPYVPFEGQRLAGLTETQKGVTQDILSREMPGQFGTGTTIATSGGLGALGYGERAAQVGQQLGEQFASPETVQKYMSPYTQAVTDIQKREAIRSAQQGQLAQNLASARQGTYGGARQTIAATERERNLQDQLAKIQASGDQAAYDQAIKAIQASNAAQIAGLQTGLQGAQAASQAGATLGQLGIGEQQQFENLQKLRAAAAGEEQAMSQKELDLMYQDFISQQQDPYKQLGFLSDILRGSANLAATGGKTVYEQQPSVLSQMVGPGLLGLGLYKELGR